MMLGNLRPGELYAPEARGCPPHNVVYFGSAGLFIVEFWEGNCYHDALAVTRSTMELALATFEGVTFILYRLGRMPWSDYDYSFRRAAETAEDGDRPDLADDKDELPLQVVIVEAATGIVRAARRETIRGPFVAKLRELAARDAALGFSDDDRAWRLGSVHALFPAPADLATLATVRVTLPSSEGGGGGVVELEAEAA